MWALNPFVSHQLRRAELSEQPAMLQSYSNEVVYSCVSLPGMDTPCRVLIIASLVLISTAFTACGVRGDKGSMPARGRERFPRGDPNVANIGRHCSHSPVQWNRNFS